MCYNINRRKKKILLYHGSNRPFKILKNDQLTNSPDKDRKERERKRRNVIYLSSSFAFALFFAAKPKLGKNMMSIKRGIVYFEKLDKLNPEEDVYIQIIDIADIPKEKRRWANEYELEVQLDEIKPVRIEIHKAGEIFEHFEVIKDEEEFERRKAS
tara:strand:+ start:447 stop:914 length:468 start_codon:yes stop_codon:yes gene_type:complete